MQSNTDGLGANRDVTDGSRATILIVDDEELVARMLATGFTEAGFKVTVAANGLAALQCLSERPVDVLLSDVQMPGIRGDVLQRRAREQQPDLIVLLVTAVQEVTCAVQCLQEGVADYLTKPFHLSNVIVRVNRALQQRDLLRQQQRLERENQNYQAALEQRVAEQANQMRQMLLQSLQALNYALEAKDVYTHNHSARVADVAAALASCLCPGDANFRSRVGLAALFHDIGKIGVPEAILNKPDRLEPAEFDAIKKHPEMGETILRPLFSDPDILSIVRSHHEQWGGDGYPDGLRGDLIPLGARIVAVADSYDAMTSARAYRPGMSHECACRILQKGMGRQWDAEVVQTFLTIAAQGMPPMALLRTVVEDVEDDVLHVFSHSYNGLPALNLAAGLAA